MRRPNVAFLLSFLLPGAGLWYLGKWKYGLLNLGAVLLLGVALAIVLPEEVLDAWAHYLAAGIAGGSGGLAYGVAVRLNQKRKTDATSTGPEEPRPPQA